ncbi:MAG: hypothetical protein A2086_08820 [Spirochaetes bacterium GWD1_27_9]|nr:MAG: hypothetical protein A2Z98_11185 [Spirochaetes bacterium GWB1_27_13]OHD21627.1 MAG: hypothetical protein A2Y34_15100 [Spirochaetes bacterium GWC1_27_15]OHD37953.1 MAG: hypothetical protein A2086_08820 [Spirochaetes bacterium GWD1_27_9]
MISQNPLITLGSPYGIGYEIFLLTLQNTNLFSENKPFVIGSKQIMDFFQKLLDFKLNYLSVNIEEIDNIKNINLADYKFVLLDVANPQKEIKELNDITKYIDGEIAFKSIDIAADLVSKNYFKSIVTLPVSKENINLIDKTFMGHTEFFQKKWNEQKVFMTFVSSKLNMLLLTTHIPLKEVSNHITEELVESGIKASIELKNRLGLQKKIGFLGINPHSGENGLIGTEEIWIKDIIAKYSKDIDGPIPADTAFTSFNIKKYDIYITSYHDQGLIPFKMLAFDEGVNLSFGMKYIRTSVDHGTAVGLVGKKIAGLDSFINAYNVAVRLG